MLEFFGDYLYVPFQASIQIGIIYGIGAIGLGLIYKYLQFPDFTTISSIVVGSVLMVVASNKYGVGFGILSSILIGCFLGLVTSFQIVIMRIPSILAGIITSVGAISLAFFINSNKEPAHFDDELRPTLDYFANDIFTWQSLITIFIFSGLISYLISLLFKTKYGLFILAMLSSPNYLKYRHRKSKITQVLLISIGNGIIGFAGALAASQNGMANVYSHKDFLVTALGGFVLGNYFTNRYSQKNITNYLEKDIKPSGSILTKLVYSFLLELRRNDEEPRKIFYIFFFIVLASAFINFIFQVVEIAFDLGENSKFFVKSFILFLILIVSIWTEHLSTTLKTK